MDIRSFQVFIAVAEQRSFSEAAERLHLTQPAVSKRITALEADVGTALFDRIGRQISLTEAGRALLPRARRILEEVEDSRRALSNLSRRVEGRLALGTSHHIGLHHLPPVLRSYTSKYPKVRLDIRFLDSETACREVESGELELAIVTLPGEQPDPLRSEPIWPDPLVIATARDHPLAGRRLQPAELAEHPAILPARGTYTRVVVEQALAPFGLEPIVSLSTNYLETIKMLVGVGLGWSVLPRTMIDEELRIAEVKSLHLERSLGAVTHRARTLSNAAQRMLELLREQAGGS
jgi:DNA-binding transcriptional LysR family regulator